ncbi:hypothetical protein JK361_23485 [Streptomyces sp. 5-8]|uniref:Uncharacterized protein n=1 Tax=Streptomyces musisoli TaxID=2802280 RepID=A0ABS1P584_9ACTN|nr:hypothetical protein [Streptomyces musisoli]MBL1107524.1 hypothetical protein [Streptomyces musisoli]
MARGGGATSAGAASAGAGRAPAATRATTLADRLRSRSTMPEALRVDDAV